MRIGLLGGLRVEHDGAIVPVTGAMQLAVLFRLAVDAGTAVSYRAIAEDIWSTDAPENARAALQSIVSRLRSQLPPGVIESAVGGYRLAVSRADVDALVFSDLVSAAGVASPEVAVDLATRALSMWVGEPWVPSADFDWFERDLAADRMRAIGLGGVAIAPVTERPEATAGDSRIPVPLTSIIGRESELASISQQLRSSRLVTIIGTGGAGKTRLAIESATGRRGSYLVELAPVGPEEVLGAALAATGRELRTVETGTEPVGNRDRLIEALAGREVLLLLDNCEHVIEAVAVLAADLLASLPQLRILATSREPIGIPGEAFVGVGPLGLPDTAAIDRLDGSDLAAFAAIELFSHRATAANGESLNNDDLRVAARICARLDGLPLAIELAAAKLRTMGVDEVLDGLEDRFTLLTGGYRTALPRHQTLRAMIDWSWSLLDETERHALTRISVFPGGVGAGEVRSLAASLGLPSAAVFDALVDRSLLQRTGGRYRALETIREYGIERLAESGELAAARAAQVTHIAARAAEFDQRLRGPRVVEAVRWFDAEDDNITAALRYSTDVPLAELAVELCLACLWYWVIRDRNDSARQWLERVGVIAPAVDSDAARVIGGIAPLLVAFSGTGAEQLDPGVVIDKAATMLEPLRALTPSAGSHDLLQLFIAVVDGYASVAGNKDWMQLVELPSGEQLGLDPWPSAVLHVISAATAQNRGQIEALGAQSETAMRMFTELGDAWGLGFAQQMRAEWLTVQGRLEEALDASDQSTASMSAITSSTDLAQQQGLSVQLLLRLGRPDEARSRVTAMIANAEEGGNSRTILLAVVTSGLLEVWLGDAAAAGNRVSRAEELLGTWPSIPGQFTALLAGVKAGVSLLRGEFDDAETHLRAGAEAAIASHDQPVIGMIAIAAGTLALRKGEIERAVRAIEIATALIGAYDATHPEVKAIAEAAEKAGIGRSDAAALDRPKAIEQFTSLLGE